jgi:amidase
MDWKSICDMTALQMRQEIETGQLSARQVVEAHLASIEVRNPAINAIVTLDPEGALRQADAADAEQAANHPLGLLHGLPVAHKDSFLTAGMRTTFGSPVHRDFVPTQTSLPVTREREAGAITLGKTNLPEFGAGSHTFNPVFGATRNPYDLGRTPGGSSGGAAAALAARMLPLADGTDMGGSLRNPAGFCNVVGLRPSPGRVPQWPSNTPNSPLTVAGPMARTVADAALMLAALAVPDARDPFSFDQDPAQFASSLERDFAGTRIACALSWGGLPVEPAVLKALQAQLPVFEQLGCKLDEACPDFGDVDNAFQTLRAQNFAISQGDNLRKHRDQLKQTIIWNTELGLSQSAAALAHAERERAALSSRMSAFMQQYEFVIGVVSQVSPFAVETEYPTEIDGTPMQNYIDWMRSAYYITMTGHPAISVPCGFTADGLPVGIQIVGRYRDEWGVLQLAHAFEQATQFWKQAPVLP